jgi:hypothetical protein
MIIEERDPIHTWFSLSYSSHLVLDPVRVRQLPQDQQEELAAMLDQLERSFPDVNPHGDEVLALAGDQWEVGDLDDRQLAAIDMSVNDDLDDHADCDHEEDEDENYWCERGRTNWYDWRGQEYSRDERVTVPTETEAQARAAGRRVVSRTLLQSMPAEWQQRFVQLLHRLDHIDADTPESYDIRFYTPAGLRTTDPVPHYNRGRTQLVPTVIAS